MSAITASIPSTTTAGLGLQATGGAALPASGAAASPATAGSGSTAAKQAYAEGLQFEQVLVNELAQQLTDSISSGSGSGSGSDSTDSSDGTDGGGDAGSGLLGSDPATSLYTSLVPQALSSAVMSSGGIGIAAEIARAIDPSFGSLT